LGVGWLIAGEALVSVCMAANSMNAPFVPGLCQHLALDCLQQDAVPTPARELAHGERGRWLHEQLAQILPTPMTPNGGWFHWWAVPTGEPARQFAQRLLTATGVLVHPGELFGPSGAGCVRISHCLSDGLLQEAITRMRRWLSETAQPPERPLK
jgi:aminotransferase